MGDSEGEAKVKELTLNYYLQEGKSTKNEDKRQNTGQEVVTKC